jgi:polysaccharide chain length determinant protein (PEP-CTERM system associated)
MEQSNKTLFDYIDIFYRRKWMLVIPLLLGTGIAVFVSFKLPSYYRSTTLILVEQQKVPEAYVTPTDTTPIEQRLSTMKQQIMSRTRLEQIINEFNLYKDDAGSVLKEDIIERIRDNIEIDIIGGDRRRPSNAFSISYTGREPYTTMQVTNTLASLFIEENLKTRERYAEGTSEFIISELEKAKKELEVQEKTFREFKERHMGALPEQLDANLRTLDRLQLELQSVNDALKNADDREILLKGQLDIGDTLMVELARLKSELASLLSLYKENYPDVVITRNRIKEVEEKLARRTDTEGQKEEELVKIEPTVQNPEAYAVLVSVRSRISTLKAREIRTREQIKTYEKRVEEIPANEQKLAAIQRDYDISLNNYQSLLEKKLNARLAENLEKRQKGERFRVIDPANLPERPFRPDKRKITLLGALAGAGLGIALVYLIELLNPAFRKPEDFEELLPLTVLAVIPAFSKRPREGHKRLKVIRGRKSAG